MKTKSNAGFSLVEVLVAIVLLGTLVVPICSSLLLTFRMNEKTDNLLQAQLAVSSAAETLLAEGINEAKIAEFYDGRTDMANALTESDIEQESQTPGEEDAAQPGEEEEEETVARPYNDGTGRFSEVRIEVYVLPSRYIDGVDAYQSSYDCYTVKVTSRYEESVWVVTTIREMKEVAAS